MFLFITLVVSISVTRTIPFFQCRRRRRKHGQGIREKRVYLYPYTEIQKPHTDSPSHPYTAAYSSYANTAQLSRAAPDAKYHAA